MDAHELSDIDVKIARQCALKRVSITDAYPDDTGTLRRMVCFNVDGNWTLARIKNVCRLVADVLKGRFCDDMRIEELSVEFPVVYDNMVVKDVSPFSVIREDPL